jgi:hypothetical protein
LERSSTRSLVQGGRAHAELGERDRGEPTGERDRGAPGRARACAAIATVTIATTPIAIATAANVEVGGTLPL